MAEPDQSAAAADGGLRRFLTFRWQTSLYALPVEEVAEVVRTPLYARVPHSPRGLLGIANLRGSVLPVASLGGLLGLGTGEMGQSLPRDRAQWFRHPWRLSWTPWMPWCRSTRTMWKQRRR